MRDSIKEGYNEAVEFSKGRWEAIKEEYRKIPEFTMSDFLGGLSLAAILYVTIWGSVMYIMTKMALGGSY